MLKFPVDGGTVTIYNTAAPPKECNTVTCDVSQLRRQHAQSANLEGRVIPITRRRSIDGGSLSVLSDTEGYSPGKAEKKRGQALELAKAILEEVHKLVEAVSIHLRMIDWKEVEIRSPYADTPSSASWSIQGVSPYPNGQDDEEKTSLSHKSRCRSLSIAIQDAFWPKRIWVPTYSDCRQSLPLFKNQKCTRRGLPIVGLQRQRLEEVSRQAHSSIYSSTSQRCVPRPGEKLDYVFIANKGQLAACY
ncbi:hypothetical protein Tco_0412726 [Tanacetum coccineum]